MSAIGLRNDLRIHPRIISAHADHNRSDFIFQRCQSLALRDAPWERRLKPMKTWGEIGTYAAACLAGAAALTTAVTALI